jgi:hypothetical protein
VRAALGVLGRTVNLAGSEPRWPVSPLDRLDLLDHGRLLIGEDARSVVARPELAELLVAGAEFALGHLSGPEAAGTPLGRGPAPLPERRRNGRYPHPSATGLPRSPAADQGRALPGPLPVHRGDGTGWQQRRGRRALPGQRGRARRRAGCGGSCLAPPTAGRRRGYRARRDAN